MAALDVMKAFDAMVGWHDCVGIDLPRIDDSLSQLAHGPNNPRGADSAFRDS